MNVGRVYSDTNQTNHTEKLDFQHIYADDNDVLNPILFHIENVWDLKYANGRMRRT